MVQTSTLSLDFIREACLFEHTKALGMLVHQYKTFEINFKLLEGLRETFISGTSAKRSPVDLLK